MNSSERKAKIRWQSRRGMLELDVLLGRYLASKLDTMTDTELDHCDLLLDQADPDLYAWLMGYETPSQKELADFVTLIRAFHHRTPLD